MEYAILLSKEEEGILLIR